MRAHTLGLYLKQNMGRWQQGWQRPFRQHQQCAAAEIIGRMVQDPNRRPATKAIPAGDAKSSHFKIISVSTGDRRKLVGIYDRHGQQLIWVRHKR
jgi:hypothetical protein